MSETLRIPGAAGGLAGNPDSQARPLLPATLKAFLRRRLKEAGGVALFAAGTWMLVSVFSYSPSDPSLNGATSLAPTNVLGRPGAVFSDLALQAFGFACFVPILTLMVWGGRTVRHKGLGSPWYRLLALIGATVLYAVGLGVLPINDDWPLMSGMGGFTGSLLLDAATSVGPLQELAYAKALLGIGAGMIGVVLWILALGLSSGDWRRIGQGSLRAFSWLRTGISKSHKAFGVMPAWGRRADGGERNEPHFAEDLDPGDAVTGEIEVHVRVGEDDGEAMGEAGAAASAPPKRSGLVATRREKLKEGRKAKSRRQGRLNLGDGVYTPPPIDLLAAPESNPKADAHNKDSLQQNATFLGSVLEDFGVKGEIVKVRPGPVVTLYELEPAPGTKTSRVIGLSDDIARSMSAVSVRVAVVTGRNVIGIELPNVNREMVYLRELLASQDFEKSGAKLPLALGKDIGGAPVTADLARMPHLLIAGTTGSGKSVAMNTMILSLLYQCSPDDCKFIMIDPKMLELSVYDNIPHLLTPVVTDPSKAVVALKWTVREMEDRYRAMSQLGVRNIAGYNARIAEAKKKGEVLNRRVQTGFDDDGKPIFEDQPLSSEPLPFIVVVVDEMADLMLVAGKDVEAAIQRLAQMARAAGIHLIMATQRPSVDVITGTIKANFPTRISFQVTSKIDSRTILGEQGAEQLLGQGDMLYMAGGGRVTRTHGPFVSDEEVEEIVKHLKAQGAPAYVTEVTEEDDSIGEAGGGGNSGDALYDEAVALVAREGKASTSFIQRHLQIGYNRAARIIETMEKEGVVSPANRVGRREVLIGNH